MDAQHTNNDVIALEKEIAELKHKLSRARGFLDFLENDPDPSHAIRSPLVSIQSFLGVLEMSNYDMEKEEMKEMVEEVKLSSSKLLSIVDKMLKSL